MVRAHELLAADEQTRQDKMEIRGSERLVRLTASECYLSSSGREASRCGGSDRSSVEWMRVCWIGTGQGTRTRGKEIPSARCTLPHSIKMVGARPMSLGKGRDMALEALGVVRSRHTSPPTPGLKLGKERATSCPWIVGVTDRGVSGEALIDATAPPADPGLASASQSRRSKMARWAA